MSVYVLAQLSILDRDTYDRYAARFMDVLDRYDGRLLVADEAPNVLEGSWAHEKVVLLEFPDRQQLERWSSSREYVDIARDRLASTTGCVVVMEGLAG